VSKAELLRRALDSPAGAQERHNGASLPECRRDAGSALASIPAIWDLCRLSAFRGRTELLEYAGRVSVSDQYSTIFPSRTRWMTMPALSTSL
jgi:hypothetical protein